MYSTSPIVSVFPTTWATLPGGGMGGTSDSLRWNANNSTSVTMTKPRNAPIGSWG